ncbi:DoxX family protein [Paenibacillus tarimensis]
MKNQVEAGLLIVRLVLGITFVIHGIEKFQMGIGNVSGWFGSMGIPGFMAYIIAIIELVGGIAMILGLGTRIVGILFAATMIGAIFKVKLASGFTGNGQMAGYELDLALLAISVLLALSGSRLWSVDSLLFNSKGSKAIAN